MRACWPALAGYGQSDDQYPSLTLLAENSDRVAFLPRSFSRPIETTYVENIAGEPIPIWVGSLRSLWADLCGIAPGLGIPLEDDRLSDETAQKINDYEAIDSEDSGEPDSRTAWLLLYEGCRMAMASEVALAFAG